MDFKKALSFIENEFVYGGHLLSAGAASIVFTAAFLLDIKITLDFLVIVYLLSYVAYSYNRFAEIGNDFLTNSSRANHISKYAKYFSFILFFALALVLFLLFKFGNIESFVFGFAMIILSVLYTLFFKHITKKIIGFKSFYVALIWASLVILLAIYYKEPLGEGLFLFFIFVFFRWIINTSFCDLKDLAGDKKEGLKTFAVVFGHRNWVSYLSVFNVMTIIPIVFGVFLGVLPVYSLSLILCLLYAAYYLHVSVKSKISINVLSDVFADAEFVLWSVFVIIGKIFL